MRHCKHHIHRHDLCDDSHAVGIAAAHRVAHVHRAQADPATDGRRDTGIAQIELRYANGGIVHHNRAFELLDKRGLRINFLPRDRVLGEQCFKPLQRDPGAVELGRITLALTPGLRQRQLHLARIKCGQQLACPHHLAFLEQHLFQHTRNLRAHLDSGQWCHGAQCVQRDGNAGALGSGYTHRAGTPATIAKTPTRTAGTPWATRTTRPARTTRAASASNRRCRHRAGQVPGQSTHTSE